MIYSMTGYAQQIADIPGGRLRWELRSVNHRYLELSFKLPEVVREVEFELREMARGTLNRGKVDCVLHLEAAQLETVDFVLNEPALDNLLAACNKLATRINLAPVSAIDVLNWPGIVQRSKIEHSELFAGVKLAFQQGLKKLQTARSSEGAELLALIKTKLVSILQHAQHLTSRMPEILQQQHENLQTKIKELNLTPDPSRLAQELVFLAQKADVSEELERLQIHAQEFEQAGSQGGAIGRKLDFLLQEMNREANTLASKAIGSDTSLIVVELKVLIEQIREQVQNIE